VLQRVRATPALVAEMHDCIHALEAAGVLAAVGVDQVENHDILEFLALAILLCDIDQDQIVPLTKGWQQLAGNITLRHLSARLWCWP